MSVLLAGNHVDELEIRFERHCILFLFMFGTERTQMKFVLHTRSNFTLQTYHSSRLV